MNHKTTFPLSPNRNRRRLVKQFAASLIVAGLLCAAPWIVVAQDIQDIELSLLGTVHPGFRMQGIDAEDYSGGSVSGAGDVNGDGLADLIVGSRGADIRAGECYVIFGRKVGVDVDVSALGSVGFRIDGVGPFDYSGASVSGAGDINGDGLGDVIVGAWGARPFGNVRTCASYVVFGKADNSTVNLGSLGSAGFRLAGIRNHDAAGVGVSGAGDVNGDGFADLIIGAPHADPGGFSKAGESYVVFGKADNEDIDLASLGSAGFQLNGIDVYDTSGYGVSGAGDVNGDGLADLIVGAPKADHDGEDDAGETYVIFGKTDSDVVDLSALGTAGFRIDGEAGGDESGRSVSGAGDVNGDGLADLIVGAREADSGQIDDGQSYVVFGKSDNLTVNLDDLGSGGFRLNGIDRNDYSGWGVSGAGDINGDGFGDLIIGAYGGDPNGKSGAGESYVIFGKSDNFDVELSRVGLGEGLGFRLNGIDGTDHSGCSVSSAGDMNGDGLADMTIGAFGANHGGIWTGESYVVCSPATPPPSASYRAYALADNAPRLAIGICGDGSDDSSPSSRCWIDFADGSGPGLNGSSMQTVTITRNDNGIHDGLTPAEAANVRWEVSTNRTNWTEATFTFKYTNAEIAGLNEGTLSLYHAFFSNGPWVKVPTTLDTARNMASARLPFGGFFAIGGPANAGWQVLGVGSDE